MIISDPGGSYPIENYTITEYDIANPGDIDGDGIDDMTELNNMPTDAPINFAQAIDFEDGATSIPDAETFIILSPFFFTGLSYSLYSIFSLPVNTIAFIIRLPINSK